MIPVALSNPSLPVSARSDNPAELAKQPLRFTAERSCQNREVLTAIADVLSVHISSDWLVATILSNAYHHHYQAELNQLISTIPHSPDSLIINPNVLRMLADQGIILTRHINGSVRLSRASDRHEAIRCAMPNFFPDELSKLISAFDEDMEISAKNADIITEILMSTDRSAKGLLIACASRQTKICFLNDLLNDLRSRKMTVDLSWVDLSNLNLDWINLASMKLSHANFQNSSLRLANLSNTCLRHANLNQADLSFAILAAADLTGARLIKATLHKTRLQGSQLAYANMLCAHLEGIGSMLTNSTVSTVCQFASPTDVASAISSPISGGINAPVDAIILADLQDCDVDCDCDCDSDRTIKPGINRNLITITQSEKMLLLASGIEIASYGDGTVRLSKPMTTVRNTARHHRITSTLEHTLPTVLTKLIAGYDDEISFGEVNEHDLLNILKSQDRNAKGQILAAASAQAQIPYLNALLGRLREIGNPANLSRVDLSNLDLSGINLDQINLTGAIMHGCNLDRASLTGTCLSGTNLNGTSLISARIDQANFTAARMMGANLSDAIITRSLFKGAVLKFANLSRIECQEHSDFTAAWLDHAILDEALFHNTAMTGASLTHAQMSSTTLHIVNLTNARLQHAEVIHGRMVETNLTNADCSHARLHDVYLQAGTVLTGAIWTGASFSQIHAASAVKKTLPLRMWLGTVSHSK